MSPSNVRIAIAQMCSTSSVERNLSTIQSFARLARDANASMLFLPENACFMGLPGTKMSLDVAESLDEGSREERTSGIVARLRAISREANVWLSVGGFQERAGNDKVFNTHIVFDDRGNIVSRYRKIHLFDYAAGGLVESRLTAPGDDVVLCDTPFGVTLGLSVCFDVRFPMLYVKLRERGANVMLIPAAFHPTTGAAHWETLLRARAIETQSFVIAAAQAGAHNEKRSSYGHGMVCNPWGEVLCCLSGEEEIRVVELDLGLVEEVRRTMPLYSPL